MNTINKIQCPNCGGQILFDPQLLVQGESFYCNTCNASIGISNQSKDQAQKAMNQFNLLKKN